MSRLEEQDFDEKRLLRRQRRKRSQLIAYIVLVFVVVAIGVGVAFGVHYVRKSLGNTQVVTSEQPMDEASVEVSSVAVETPQEVVPEPQEMSESDVLNEIVSGIVSEMSIEDKVAGLFIVTPEQLTGVPTVVKAGSGTQDALAKYAVGGLVYSAKNLKSEDQTVDMLKATAEMSKYPLFTSIKEDASDSSVITSSIGGIEKADINSSDAAYSVSTSIAAAMFKYGFNLDISPSLDITEGGRYGTDIAVVKDITGSFISGLKDSGISVCVYDFPVSASDNSEATDSLTSETLATGAYEVYRNALSAGADAVMLSNAAIPQVTGDDTPVSLSQKMIQEELRGVLGFDGVVITGPLNEKAITEKYSSDEAAVTALNAGADMLYIPEDFEAAYQGILRALAEGAISEDRINESITRIYRIKYADRVDQITEN